MPEGLYKAVEAHSWNWVRGAIENGYSDANERSEHDWTPLHRAVSCNYELEWIEFLLALGADPNAREESSPEIHGTTHYTGATPFHYVHSVEHARLLLDAGVQINIQDDSGWTLLHHAAFHGNTELVKFLLDSGAHINIPNQTGITPLHAGVNGWKYGSAETVKQMIEYGKDQLLTEAQADLTARDQQGKTLLHFAAGQNVDAVCYFLILGLAVNAKDDSGRTALYYAADAEIMKTLVKAGGDISIVDQNGVSLLEWFMTGNVNLEIVKFLYEQGAQYPDFSYPCDIVCSEHFPVNNKRWDLFRYLVETKKTDFICPLCDKGSVLIVAAKQQNWEIVKFLLPQISEHNKSIVDIKDIDGNSVLFLAIKSKDTGIVRNLIEFGAEIKGNDEFLLDLAKNDSDFLIFLLEHGVDTNASSGADSILAEWVEDGNVAGVRILKKYGARITPELLEKADTDEMKQLLRSFLAEKE